MSCSCEVLDLASRPDRSTQDFFISIHNLSFAVGFSPVVLYLDLCHPSLLLNHNRIIFLVHGMVSLCLRGGQGDAIVADYPNLNATLIFHLQKL